MPSPNPATSVGLEIAAVGRTQADTVQGCAAVVGGGPSNQPITPGPLPCASTFTGPNTTSSPVAAPAGRKASPNCKMPNRQRSADLSFIEGCDEGETWNNGRRRSSWRQTFAPHSLARDEFLNAKSGFWVVPHPNINGQRRMTVGV